VVVAVLIAKVRGVTGGVDTHLDVHVAAVVDANGGVLAVESFPTTPAGHRAVSAWLLSFGAVGRRVILPGFEERLYLLNYDDGNIAIEVGPEGDSLPDYLQLVEPIIDSIEFGDG
jgi:hypothetical protein